MEIAEAEAARREGNSEPNFTPHSLMLELDLTHRAEKNTEKVEVKCLYVYYGNQNYV